MEIEDYENIVFKDKPDLTTPIISASLNHIGNGILNNREYIKQIDERLSQFEMENVEVLEIWHFIIFHILS